MRKENESTNSLKQLIKKFFKPFKDYFIGDVLARLDKVEQRVAIPCGKDEVLLRSMSGYLLCPAQDFTALSYLIETNGDPEMGTRLIIERVLRPGDVFVDIGAHLGIHILAAARAIQGLGNIIAFEPFESSCNLIRKTIRMNGFERITEIHQAAISNVTGEQQFYLAAGSAQHSLYSFEDTGPSGESVVVPSFKLDDVLANKTRINLIKIDVEGAETDVIEGATLTIERHPDIAIIVEFGPTHLKRVGTKTTQEWLDVFTKLGLIYRVINEATGALEKKTAEQLEHVDIVNLLFAREGSAVWAKVGI